MILNILIVFFDQDIIPIVDPDHVLDQRAFPFHGQGQRVGRDGEVRTGIVEVDIRIQAINTIGIPVIAVIVPFIGDIQYDQQANGQAGGEADNVHGGKSLAFPQIAEGDLQVISEHSTGKGGNTMPRCNSLVFNR